MPFWPPLPQDENNVNSIVRRLRAIDGEFLGAITAQRGTITGDLDVSGDLTLSGTLTVSGTIRTAVSGQRVEITDNDRIRFYTGLVAETAHGYIRADNSTATPSLTLYSPSITTGDHQQLIYADKIQMLASGSHSFLLDIDSNAAGGEVNVFGSIVRMWDVVGGANTEGLWVQNGVGTVICKIESNSAGRFGLYAYTGTAGAPAYSFDVDGNTGMFRSGVDIIGMSAGGVEKVRIDGPQSYAFFGLTAGDPMVKSGATSTSVAGFSFNTDGNTGIYRAGAGSTGITGGGLQQLIARFGNVHGDLRLYGLVSNGADPYLRWNTSTGRVRWDSSSLRIKTNIKPLEYDPDLIPSLRPVTYDRKDGTGGGLIGMVAEQVAAVDPRLATWGHLEQPDIDDTTPPDFEVIGNNWDGIITALVLEVQELRKKVDACHSSHCGWGANSRARPGEAPPNRS